MLRYKSSLPKTEHDGVLVFSDTVPWSGAAEDLDDFRRGVGESDPTGAGCFVRETRAVYSLSDAGTEVDAEVAQTIQALDKRLDQGQRVIVPSGSFTCSDAYVDRLQLEGASKLSTLKAGPGAARVIDFGRHAEDWNFYSIKNLAFDGNGKQSDGVRFNDKTPGLEEFGGRWSFRYCKFTNAKRGAFHEKGNIGNRYRDCSFKNNDFGLYLMSPSGGEVMHTGATYMEGGEVSGSALAGIYVNDSQEGTGQHTFNNVIIEDNPGFGVFMDLNGKVPYSGVVFDNVWLESNATSPSVTIGGQTYTPRNIRLDNVPAVEFRNMYLSNIELNNSKAVASNCRIDDAQGQGLRLFVDEDSALVCDNLFMMGAVGPVPFVRSIAFQGRSSNSTNLSVRGPLAVGYSAISGRALYNETFSGDGPWGFVGTVSRNATKVSDGVISASCAELTIDSGQQLVFNKRSAPTPGKWVVWGVHAKLMSGSLTRSEIGYDHLFGAVYLRPGQWVRSYGLQKIGDSVAENGLFFSNSSGSPATVRIADMYAAEFDTFEEAIEFCNSRIAVRD